MAQQTAIQWLKEQYINRGETLPSGVFQEALEMEKEQLIDAWGNGDKHEPWRNDPKTGEQYYNETYKSNDSDR